MPKLGRLSVFEGPDGVGKSTLSRGVAECLSFEGVPCVYLAFPGQEAGTLGHLVYQIHHHPESFHITSMSQTSLQILHIAAHIDAIENRILPAIEAGKVVLLDRFWWSTLVYGTVSGVRPDSLHAMIELEKLHWGPLQPTVAFLVTCDKPLQNEIDRHDWKKLCGEYEKLAREQQRCYDIIKIKNAASISHAVGQIVQQIVASNRQETLKKNAK